jgi:hypothetical protein
MPYFIYRISPQRFLTYVNEFAHYREARHTARQMRQEQPQDDLDTVKIIFAKDRGDAESVLKTPRERKPSEDD